MRRTPFVVIAFIGAATFHAHAWEFRSRFVERIGNTDIVIDNDLLYIGGLHEPRRIRMQFGVFDTPGSPAPAGGFIGWLDGSIHLGGGGFDASLTRTPGRLAPFTFSSSPNANGFPPLPAGDPFVTITEIHNTLGVQSMVWNCGPDGTPLPMPEPTLYGRNAFVSVYEITVDPAQHTTVFPVTFAGDLAAATEWRIVGHAFPPECDGPGGPIPSSVTWAPFPTPLVPFERTLVFFIPAPGVAPLIGALLLRPRLRPRVNRRST